MEKRFTGQSVLEAAKERLSFTFDNFEKIYISFSGGKDSTAVFHLVMDECIKRNRKVGVMFIDWECQFTLTIEHIKQMFIKYKDYIDLYWIQIPILTYNSCSMFEPTYSCWDEEKEHLWVRDKDPMAIRDKNFFPFFYKDIQFEEFIVLFGKWYSEGKDTACFVGIRTGESLNRWRTIFRDKPTFQGKQFSTNVVDNIWNIYPIYDWKTQDDWIYFNKSGNEYNKLYDRMHQAGLSIHQMRIDEPFGIEPRKTLWLYQIVEPKMWAKLVARMSGVNSGALYCQEKGNILGNSKVALPNGHTWESFSNLLLNTMPPKTAEHYKNKIAVYLKWYRERGYPDGIPDAGDYRLEQAGKIPSWRLICKALLRNDYWCKGLGFSVTKSSAYQRYLDLMRKRRTEWGIFA